jgi:hypothetical protein
LIDIDRSTDIAAVVDVKIGSRGQLHHKLS